MKKILTLMVLIATCNSIFAFTTQGNWRWRKDDGSQTTATWIAAQNTAPVIASGTDPLRLRIELYNNPEDPGGSLDNAIFEDSSNLPGAHWDTIKVIGDIDDAFVLAGTSPNVVDKEATTQQLTAPHYTSFLPGKVIVSSEKLPASTVGDNGGTEYEYAIKPTANLLPNITYYFRVDAANYPPDMPLPSLTTAGVLPVSLSDFSVKRQEQIVKLEWITASEQNNDRFQVQRSSDGKTWKMIAGIKGKGSTSTSNTYQVYDEHPLSGDNFYVIRQYDIDGHFHESAVKFVKMPETKAVVSVYPNPSHAGVNFSIENMGIADIDATLTNVNGGVVHHETFKNIPANAVNKLNLSQQPAPGVYILKLKANGLSESLRVVIQ